MNLVIDIGNTLTKTAVFNRNKLLFFSSFESRLDGTFDVLKNLIVRWNTDSVPLVGAKNPSIKNVILSSVIEHDKNISEFLKSNYYFIELTHLTKIPIENLYHSPQTLGKDRLASAVGTNFFFRNQNVLSIDAGTCIKYDFVNSKNQYLGGGISPGIEMRFKALHHFTDKLPLLNYRNFTQLIGQNTDESILSGVINGTAEEVKGILARYSKQYPNIKVVFTGGYLKFFERIFNPVQIGSDNKNSNIFADAFLVLRGLNVILNHNITTNNK